VVETDFVVSLIRHFFFFGVVFGIRAAEEGTISGLAEPVRTSLEIISMMLVVLSLRRFAHKFFSVSTFAPERETWFGKLVIDLDVLVGSPESWEMHSVRTQGEIGSASFEQVFGVRFLDFISVVSSVAVSVDGVHVKMPTFDFVIVFVVVDQVGNECFLVVTALIGGVFGELRFDNVEFRQVSPTVAFIAELIVNMLAADIFQFGGSFIE
jgi:hypothetical protein